MCGSAIVTAKTIEENTEPLRDDKRKEKPKGIRRFFSSGLRESESCNNSSNDIDVCTRRNGVEKAGLFRGIFNSGTKGNKSKSKKECSEKKNGKTQSIGMLLILVAKITIVLYSAQDLFAQIYFLHHP